MRINYCSIAQRLARQLYLAVTSVAAAVDPVSKEEFINYVVNNVIKLTSVATDAKLYAKIYVDPAKKTAVSDVNIRSVV